jgi:hydroxymethylpyrimidine/phosphomethylpyrimidine kinase
MSINTPITLSIAGSDSSGGAGIQADIKAISATGGFACTAITALTAQNTLGVQGISPVPLDFIRQQIDSVFDDLDVRAVKIGMLGDADTIQCVASALAHHKPAVVIVDPVMVASSGDLLLQKEAVSALQLHLLPLADLITPNLYEAQVLLWEAGQALPQNDYEMIAMAKRLEQQGAKAVLLKGGHGLGMQSTDVLCENGEHTLLHGPRYPTENTHGTGCSLSSAIASYCAQGMALHTAVELGKGYISQAIAGADRLAVGAGAGPVDHFFAWRS